MDSFEGELCPATSFTVVSEGSEALALSELLNASIEYRSAVKQQSNVLLMKIIARRKLYIQPLLAWLCFVEFRYVG